MFSMVTCSVLFIHLRKNKTPGRLVMEVRVGGGRAFGLPVGVMGIRAGFCLSHFSVPENIHL
jgi:hypothetical protein